jgi:hypothetical protein
MILHWTPGAVFQVLCLMVGAMSQALRDVAEDLFYVTYVEEVCHPLKSDRWFDQLWMDVSDMVYHPGTSSLVCDLTQYRVPGEILQFFIGAAPAIYYAGLTTLLCACAQLAWNLYSEYNRTCPVGNRWRSFTLFVLIKLVEQPRQATCTLRSIFMNLAHVRNFPARNHTHPVAAKVRNDGSSFMDLFAEMVGRRPYFLQKSAADDRHSRAGCRTYHWAKDLSAPYADYDPDPEDVLCIVDVDMYMDMPALLATQFQPVLLTTFQPTTVAKSDGEYSFTFNANNTVRYTVSGGATYEHKVWNYGTDVVVASTRRYGIMWHHHVYNVDRRATDEHHELVLLTPIKRIVCPFLDIPARLGCPRLEHLSVAETLLDKYGKEQSFTRMTVHTKNGLYRSTGKPGSVAVAWISAKDDDALASLARVGNNIELTPATVKTVVKDADQVAATILTEYHRLKQGEETTVVFPVDKSVFNFQHTPAVYDPTAKPSMIPFMSPLVLGCYAPTRTLSNDAAAINGRITSVKAPDDISITTNQLRYMREFAEFLIPVPHSGHPVDHTQVWEQQHRPAQRQILARAGLISDLTVDAPVQSFQKSEAYAKVTDPRIISTIPGVNKNNYSRYIYSFTTVLRATKWYAFALAPLAVAQRVAALCTTALMVVLTDLSRFDGRVSKTLRYLEHLLMMRYFHVSHHKELCELMASQKNQRAFTTFGVKYETGETRCSGSPETADFNSVDNAFMAYVALRETGRAPAEAWDGLGIYGGDDGVTPNVQAATYVKTCADVGQVLEIDIVRRGDAGVCFLAREYGLEVWHGAMDSMCDIRRQLTKLHTTVSLPATISPFRKFSEKIYSYYLTDKNTPIIGEIARMFVRAFPGSVPTKDRIDTLWQYHSLAEEGQQYPNNDSALSWMEDRVKVALPNFDRAKLREWLALVEGTKSEEACLRPPVCDSLSVEHEVKAPVVINGTIVEPQQKTPRREYTPADLEKMSKKPCHDHAAGKCKKADKCRFKH